MSGIKDIRNIGIVAHVDAGKTTITEHMLFESGGIRAIGSVDRGTAQTDWLDVERERGISVRAASTAFVWKGVNINLIDTPGHVDFSAEVERALRVLDGAVLVISAVEGIQAQTEVLWKALQAMKIPTIFFINKTDRAGSDVSAVIKEIKRLFTPYPLQLQILGGEGTASPEAVDLLCEEEALFPRAHGQAEEVFCRAFERVVETLVDYDDALFERFLSGEEFSADELSAKLACCIQCLELFPVLYGSAIKGMGITSLLDAVVKYLPPPSGSEELPVSGVVFRLEHDRTMGRIAHVRLYNGIVKNRDTVFNVTQDKDEKITQIRKVYARRHEDTGMLRAGDIAGVCGFSHTRIGDVIGCADAVPPGFSLAVPLLKVQAFSGSEAEHPKLVAALQELSDEDPLLDLQWLKEERELHVRIMV